MFILLSLLAAAWRPHVYRDEMGEEKPTVVLGAVSLGDGPRAVIQANCQKEGPVLFFSTSTYIDLYAKTAKVSHGAPIPGVEANEPPEIKTYAFDRLATDFGLIKGSPFFTAIIRRPGRTVFQIDGHLYRFDLDGSVLAPWYATCIAKGQVPEGYLGEPATTPPAPPKEGP